MDHKEKKKEKKYYLMGNLMPFKADPANGSTFCPARLRGHIASHWDAERVSNLTRNNSTWITKATRYQTESQLSLLVPPVAKIPAEKNKFLFLSTDAIPAGSEALPTGSEVLPACFEARSAGSEALPRDSETLPASPEAHQPGSETPSS